MYNENSTNNKSKETTDIFTVNTVTNNYMLSEKGIYNTNPTIKPLQISIKSQTSPHQLHKI